MSSSRYWKNSLKKIDNGLDKCRSTIDALSETDKDQFRKEVYSSPNTLVEVSIKTKKSKTPTKKSVTSTKISKRNIYHGNTILNNNRRKLTKPITAPKKPQNVETSESNKKITFQNRTLKVFISEIKSVLLQDDIKQAIDLLDDVEYIALKMNPDGQTRSPPSPINNKKIFFNDNLKTLTSENNKLKSDISDIEEGLNSKLAEKDKEILDLKSIISRLSETNQDMVHHVKDKAKLEALTKELQDLNKQLTFSLENEHSKVIKYQKALKERQKEVERLHRVIEDLKSTLSRDLEVLKNSKKRTPFIEEDPTFTSNISKLDIETLDDLEKTSKDPERSLSTITDEGIFSESLALPVSSAKLLPMIKQPAKPVSSNPNSYAAIFTAQEVMDNKIKEFLERMKQRANLEISMPEFPGGKSFNEPSIPLDLSNETNPQNPSSENAFVQGLEASLYLSSNDSS